MKYVRRKAASEKGADSGAKKQAASKAILEAYTNIIRGKGSCCLKTENSDFNLATVKPPQKWSKQHTLYHKEKKSKEKGKYCHNIVTFFYI